MNIKSIQVSPHIYEVIYDDKLTSAAGVTGVCGTDALNIILDPSCAGGVMAETLLHECLHACWTQTALDKTYTDEQEEEMIWSLSPRILALLRDNPELVKELTS